MSKDCCSSPEPVPVLDKRIELGDTKGGNKYRRRCINCGHWLPMTSASYFESHDDPHVLPIDGDPSDLDDTIPLDEYDYSAETAELADRINATADGGHDQPPTDDEGDEADGDDQNTHDDDEQGNESANLRSASTRPASEPASSERSDSDGQEVENRFDCPRCGVEHVGYPAGCDECSAVYNW